MKQDVLEVLRIRDRPNKDTALPQIPRHIVEHTPNLSETLKGIMHAKLHRDDIEWLG